MALSPTTEALQAQLKAQKPLSAHGYNMLQVNVVNLEHVSEFDMRFFKTMVRRGYLAFNRSEQKFVITALGRAVRKAYEDSDIYRHIPQSYTCDYIDAIIHGGRSRRQPFRAFMIHEGRRTA